MSGSGGVSIARSNIGDNRFYNPPAIRRQRQQQLLMAQKLQPSITRKNRAESEKRAESGESASSSSTMLDSGDSTNLDRFLKCTTPEVPVQYLPKTSMKGWRTYETECYPYFVLGDLWEFFKEWSAYGASVPLLLNGSDSVIQYYVPYLSGMQLYIDPSRPCPKLRRPGEESDTESSRETSSDGSSDCGAESGASNLVMRTWNHQNSVGTNTQSLSRLSLSNKASKGSSSDECETSNPPGRLMFEYFEHDPPFTREPLADKVSALASQFPELKTYRSCDLLPSSWISVAWYPIYRIPMGPTLQNLDACFLTFHSLSTPLQSTSTNGMHFSIIREVRGREVSLKLPLPTFGLASYKFRVAFWNPGGVSESQKANSLLRAADNWLRSLQVNHPDYMFFVSRNS
ncbi:hypothetical protein HS088_TW01G00078 [Tripterygium wilfordii]|uniref:DUF789 family protein n=1 Tax=Tripterygium wilfordii TaxID=458696 RepID=A0A7J7E0X0_TRIWF|nr:uncharacterized protein LOC119997362 [Tripterygium wilfordii]KAF5752171.1 hypothetical protein HS088_TW01G00078 [Tripterygium wilfordii]